MGLVFSCLGSCFASICFSTCTPCFDWTMSQAARFSYLFLAFLIFLFAAVLGAKAPEKLVEYSWLTDIKLDQDCDSSNTNECIYRQLIYRASFALLITFFVMAGFAFLSDEANKKFWIIKFIITASMFIGFWFVENSLFSGWAEVARVISFIWLLVQGLLILDFSFDFHEIIIKRANDAEAAGDESRPWQVVYLIISIGFLTCAIVGLCYLYHSYAGCDLGQFFVIFTTVVGSLCTIACVSERVGKGLLTPTVMFAYAVFLCWYALQSSPQADCNPHYDSNGGQPTSDSLVVTLVISLAIMLYCVVHGTRLMNLFNVEGRGLMTAYANNDLNASLNQPARSQKIIRDDEGGNDNENGASNSSTTGIEIGVKGDDASDKRTNEQFYAESSGSWKERVFFHVLMIVFTSYAAMILTSWGASDGSPINNTSSSIRTGVESMWLKIVSQWLFFILFFRSLQVAIQENA